MKEGCTELTRNKIIVFAEKRSKLTVINPAKIEVLKVKVDDCELTEGRRCDYMFVARDLEHYVELKGQDIRYAIDQITETIHKLSKVEKRTRKMAFVITARSPLTGASIQNLRLKFKKHYGSDLIVKNSPCTHTL